MCGIAGMLRLDPGAAPITPRELRLLGDRMPWRGPDDEGFLHHGTNDQLRRFGGAATSAETFESGFAYALALEMIIVVAIVMVSYNALVKRTARWLR